MKFGLFYLPTYLPETRDAHTHYHNMVEQVVYADRIGIDYAWMVEHHFVRHGGLLPANYAFLSYLAGRTERIRLGTGATILPLNDPVRVAEQAAALDQLSKGRFDFGVGRGFIRDEFDAFGVPMKESRERVEEGVGLIRKAWSEPTLEFDGGFRPAMSGLPILPPVYQKPHPPIWVACLLSPESFEWTAREGHNLLYVAYHVDHDIAVERIGWYRDALRKAGRRIEDHEICCVYHAHFLAEGDDERLAAAVHGPMSEYAAAGLEATRNPADPVAYKGYEQRDAGQRRFTFESYFPGRVLMGGPEQAIERIRVLSDIGITQIGMLVDFGSLPQPEIMRSLEIFGEEVLPYVRDL
ncbi:MAG: LLM class flavin-dependent oxidoreductase [Defluviicoccus sp.]|nr:LLM class flavin-dependent oxidoreductase [Defluviicoccus sp.]MDE0279035.1 LLM class flavin-dependent oxidoreductase [Defluviicoccus sp.]